MLHFLQNLRRELEQFADLTNDLEKYAAQPGNIDMTQGSESNLDGPPLRKLREPIVDYEPSLPEEDHYWSDFLGGSEDDETIMEEALSRFGFIQ